MSNHTGKKLAGKVAVITGGSSGIGLATAKLFVAEGAEVFITGRRQSELDAAMKEIGGNIRAVQGDVARLDDLDRLYEIVRREKGMIDVLYANAGIVAWVPMGAVTEEHFHQIMEVNVKGVLFTVQKALPLLREGASVILVGSAAGSKGFPNYSVYGASKAAVRSFARTWTFELKDRKIRVNVLSPGPIDTPLLSSLPPAAVARIESSVPMGRMGEPEEIAMAAVFLASDDASYVTGIELFVDGGRAKSERE